MGGKCHRDSRRALRVWQSWRASWTRWTSSPDLKDGGSETVGTSVRAPSQATAGHKGLAVTFRGGTFGAGQGGP